MTPAEKGVETRRRNKERRDAKRFALCNDTETGLSILREIRDNPDSMPFDRIEAIRLIATLTGTLPD